MLLNERNFVHRIKLSASKTAFSLNAKMLISNYRKTLQQGPNDLKFKHKTQGQTILKMGKNIQTILHRDSK
jgi:hypothetical protein